MDAVLSKLVAWGERDDSIRALVLTSTRARPEGPTDDLSDYDVVVAVDDAERFAADRSWHGHYGRPIGRWGDESTVHGERTFFRGVVYDDGTKIDHTLWPVRVLDEIRRTRDLPDALDVGYRVLLDKDGRTAEWPEPTYTAHVPAKPTDDEYRALIEEFWWGTTYVAKGLRRGEVIFAKFALDHDLKHDALRRMLEWRVELDRDWTWKPGAYGRGLEQALPDDLVADLARTWVGLGVDENWRALDDTIALFRRVAREVGDSLGYRYPDELDTAATALLTSTRERGR